MKIDDSVDWDVDISVGDKVGRGNNGGVDSDVGDEVGYGYGRSFNKVFKGEMGGASVGVIDNSYWHVDSGVGSGVDISDGISFGIDYVSILVSSYYSFVGFNYGNHVVSLL